jgi:5'-3' exonuclease
MRSWAKKAKPIILWKDVNAWCLREVAHRFDLFEGWQHRNLLPLLQLIYGTLELPEVAKELKGIPATTARPVILQNQLRKVEALTQWSAKARFDWTLRWFQQDAFAKANDLEKIKTKLIELYWLEDVLCRLDQLEASLEGVTHKLAKRVNSRGTMVTQNVLVDGSNLAFRCFYAPGMSALTDKSGRPTGVILGFLRSLGALKKRFPEARLYVVWDGSSNRRKAVYAEYKANRAAHAEPIFDQMAYLRETLPGLGVWQAFNPNEEADDVIATLVRGELRDQHNVIYSTDKDMLALITDTTLVLLPGVGSRKEVLYDAKGLEAAFGVPPDQMLQLRALCGDVSDNLPGVPRVPKKILRSLVQAHHSVKGIYESSLTGVSEGQYERLRLSEPQVRLNLKLMAFVNVPVTSVEPNPDVEGVAKRLQDVGINPASILKNFEGG